MHVCTYIRTYCTSRYCSTITSCSTQTPTCPRRAWPTSWICCSQQQSPPLVHPPLSGWGRPPGLSHHTACSSCHLHLHQCPAQHNQNVRSVCVCEQVKAQHTQHTQLHSTHSKHTHTYTQHIQHTHARTHAHTHTHTQTNTQCDLTLLHVSSQHQLVADVCVDNPFLPRLDGDREVGLTATREDTLSGTHLNT